MTNTSMVNMLFIKQDKNITELLSSSPGDKLYDNKSLKNKEASKVDGNKEPYKDKLASFKTILENEVKKQTGDKKQKDNNSIEDLKKRKDIKPFYIIPKDKKKTESLLIKADKKGAEELLKKLGEGKSIKHELNHLAVNPELSVMLKNNNTGKKGAELLAKQLLKTIKTENKKENKLSAKPRLIVVDLREKAPLKKHTYNAKNNKLNKIGYDPKADKNANNKHNENVLDKEEIKLFTKNTNAQESIAELKTDVQNKHIPVKQPNPQFSQLQKNLSSELVKHTRLIIKDGGNGEIRLVLKPKTLGSVRVRVNIQDNNIVGKIFVDNNIVKELVQSSLSNLYNAFKEDGFNQAMINVFVGSEKNQAQAETEDFETKLAHDKSSDFRSNDEVISEELVSVDSLVNIVV